MLYNVATMLDGYFPGGIKISGTPAISNSAQWNNRKEVGGYAGTDLSVTVPNLLASYRGCWRHAIMYPPFTFTRFTRLGFWYWREKDDVFSALRLLFDMYKAGFFLRMKDFGSAIMPICSTFTTGSNLETLWQADFTSETADAAIFRATAESLQQPIMDERTQILVDWLSDRAIDEIGVARKASSLDDWLVARASLYLMADSLSGFAKLYKGRLTSSQRVLASQLEEIRADAGWLAASGRTRGRDGSPFLFDLSSMYGVAFEYQRIYGGTWLDKMIEDRVLVPDALREAVREGYEGAELPAFPAIKIPSGWEMPSEKMGAVLCAIFDRDPANECSFEFEDSAVVAKCKAGGHSPRQGTKGHDLEDFSLDAKKEARVELAEIRYQKVLRAKIRSSEPRGKALEGFEELSSLYPWNPQVRRELAIRNDETGDIAKAFAEMRAAILLDPGTATYWHTLSVILSRMNSPKDAVVAEAISKTIEVTQS